MTESNIQVQGFNTGRLYQADGQKVKWARLSDGVVVFNDTSRMVSGYIDEVPEWVGVEQMPRFLMGRYDRLQYSQWRKDAVRPSDLPEPDSYGSALRI